MLSQFSLTSPFHCIAYDYSCADWDSLHDHLRGASWEDIFKLGTFAASEFCEWVQVEIDIYISLIISIRSKPHSCPWFSAACSAAIVHKNHFFCMYQQNRSSAFKVRFTHGSNHYKKVI